MTNTDTRRYVVHGQMPLRRTPNSGLFTTHFKEDAFFIDFNDRAILFNSGARTEQSLQLPVYFVEQGYHMRKRLVESVGFKGGAGRIELYIQCALLPVLDSVNMDEMRRKVLEMSGQLRERLVARKEHQAALDMLMLEWCDEPLLLFEYDRQSDYLLRLKARAPIPEPPGVETRTKRGQLNYYRAYEELLCTRAASYIVNAFEKLPFVQQIELTLVRMEATPVQGLVLDRAEMIKPNQGSLRRLDPTTLPAPETRQERKEREKAKREKEKAEAEELRQLTKEKKKLSFTQRASDGADSLFDGSLPYQSPLLSARIPRQGFMDLQRSKQSYSARHALSLFDLRLDTDEETSTIREVEDYQPTENKVLASPV